MESQKTLLKAFLSERARAIRSARSLTQEEMAEKLHITSRAYGDLERGKYCFSANALLYFLLMLEYDEVQDFLDRFRQYAARECQEVA